MGPKHLQEVSEETRPQIQSVYDRGIVDFDDVLGWSLKDELRAENCSFFIRGGHIILDVFSSSQPFFCNSKEL